MSLFVTQILLPLGLKLLEVYLKNPDSSKDELILNAVKKSCHYLAGKDNNTMNYGHVESVNRAKYIGEGDNNA